MKLLLFVLMSNVQQNDEYWVAQSVSTTLAFCVLFIKICYVALE